MDENCLICEDKLTNDEIKNNFVECFHGFCDYCYFNYFKEKINNNDVENIKYPEKNCNLIICNNFIENKLSSDILLLEKYKKLKRRKQLMLNPNIKLCPYPDCESYARIGKDKYVTCIQNNHKFCINCLKYWHDYKPCKIEEDKKFEKWRNKYKVKRCPKCKLLIEKGPGCNHIFCYNCQYSFCWLCLEEYNPDHFKFGSKCFGLECATCECLSNKICLYLSRIGIFLAKFIGFSLIASFIFLFGIYTKICDKYYGNNCAMILSYFSAFFFFITFSAPLISISSFISLIMIIIWPLQNIIIKFLLDFF